MRCLLKLLVCHQEPSVTTSTGDNSPTTTTTPEAVLIKAKPAKVPQECKEFSTRFIESLTTVESHYCRAKHRDKIR